MPGDITDVVIPAINVRIDERSCATPRDIAVTILALQTEVNARNRLIMELLHTHLGLLAFQDTP